MPTAPTAPPPVIRLTDRQEAFCQAMACNTGGAEAARRAGYSAKGAKQRGAFLMRQIEIRVRIDQIRACRRAGHHTLLDEASGQVEAIITQALEKKSSALALRAIEFRLKLHGVIQDRRIAHHHHLGHSHPDADLEQLDPDAQEELDAFYFENPDTAKRVTQEPKPLTAAIAPPAKPLPRPQKHPEPKPERQIVTRNDDLFRLLPKPSASAGSLFASTALTAPIMTAPVPPFRFPAAA